MCLVYVYNKPIDKPVGGGGGRKRCVKQPSNRSVKLQRMGGGGGGGGTTTVSLSTYRYEMLNKVHRSSQKEELNSVCACDGQSG